MTRSPTGDPRGFNGLVAEFRSQAAAKEKKYMICSADIIGAGAAGTGKRRKASACGTICRLQLAPIPSGIPRPGGQVIPTGCFARSDSFYRFNANQRVSLAEYPK